MMLTPPPSVSGESLARSTPPAATDIYGRPLNLAFDSHHIEAPLDLTKDTHAAAAAAARITVVATPKSSPVILEPVTPPWKSAGEQSSGASSMRSSPVFHSHHSHQSESGYPQQQEDTLDYDEQMAVTALLSLSRASVNARC